MNRATVIRGAKGLGAAGVFFMIAHALAAHWPVIAGHVERIGWGSIAVAVAVQLLYATANAGVWSRILASLGHPLGPVVSARLWLMSEALRWLPGSIWGYCSRVTMARRHGIPAATASVSLSLEIAVTVAAWCLAAIAGFAVSGFLPGALTAPAFRGGLIGFVASIPVLAAVAAGIGKLFPDSTPGRFIHRGRKRLLELLNIRPRPRHLFVALASYSVLSLFQGLGLYFVIRAVSPESFLSVALVLGINASAWLSGFFAVGAPAGIGVREGAITLCLSQVMPVELAMVAAVTWRAVQIAVEPVCLGLCFLIRPWAGIAPLPESPQPAA